MHTRVMTFVLLTGCYLPETDSPPQPRQAQERAAPSLPAAGAGGLGSCRGDGCAPTPTRQRDGDTAASTTKTVSVKSGAPAQAPKQAALGVEIIIPAQVDCAGSLLSVVGARRAAVGQSVVLEAHNVGPDDEPHVLWSSEGTEVTVLGPSTAEVTCLEVGMHSVEVKLSQASVCPTSLDFEVECVEAQPE